MRDLKLIAIRDLLPIDSVGYSSSGPASVIIDGSSFSQTSQVRINDQPSPEWIVISDKRIIAQIPPNQVNTAINKLAVLAESPSPTRSSLLSLEMGSSFRSLQGIERMVQLFVKILLTTPGSDQFNPVIGGGLQKIIGQTVGSTVNGQVQTDLMNAINQSRDQMVRMQNQDSRTPPDEKLMSADIEAVGFDANTTTLGARIALVAMSGRQAVANLTF